MDEKLRAQLRALLRPFAADEAAGDAVFQELTARYGADGRFYHTLDHVAQMLAILNQNGRLAHNLPALQLAAWFHDAIYDPRAGDNEAQSAAWAAAVLRRLRLPESLSARVSQLILMTQSHQCPPEDGDGWLLLDADLAILGADPATYDAYARAIRQEFAFVPKMVYGSVRRQVLHSFLERERLYFHPPLFNKLECQARANLAREIARYTG